MPTSPGFGDLVTLQHLVIAYRKAKVDLFLADSPRRLDIVDYEESLEDHLEKLLEWILREDESWVTAEDFVGDFTFIPKSLKEPERKHRSLWSLPATSWERRWLQSSEKPVAEFRLMAECSVDFHVFATLWMLHVGTGLDSRLPDVAMGNRLNHGSSEKPDQLRPGTFQNYQTAYQRWRDDGLKTMRRALDADLDVVALTADVTAFYHRLDVGFLLDETFLDNVLGVELSASQTKIHRLFVCAMRAWSERVSGITGWGRVGLPVGLPASALVANLALAELDSTIVDMEPLYYGRYVDDILLVLRDRDETRDRDAVLAYLVDQAPNLLYTEVGGSDEGLSGIRFAPAYLGDSSVVFSNEKNKTFHLSGPSGYAIIDAIASNIQERNSEWRAMAAVPAAVNAIEPSVARVRRSDGDPALTLRDADEVSARKQTFSIRIRDFEGFERNLPPDAWQAERREFFRAVREHVLALPAFFEMADYLPRLASLGAACSDSDSLVPTFTVMANLPNEVRRTCLIAVSDFPVDAQTFDLILTRWAAQLAEQAVEGLARGWQGPITAGEVRELLQSVSGLRPRNAAVLQNRRALSVAHGRLAQRDLAHRAYRWWALGLPKGEPATPAQRPGVPIPRAVSQSLNLLADAVSNWRGLSRLGRAAGSADAGMAFATRPPSMMELHRVLATRDGRRFGIADVRLVRRVLRALRGSGAKPAVALRDRRDWPDVIQVRVAKQGSPVKIALVMLETDPEHTRQAAKGAPVHTSARYDALRELLEAVRVHPGRPDYVLLPELSLPQAWFDEFALSLMRSGISLIAGIEHQPRSPCGLTNQVWAALRVSGSRSSYFTYIQDKQRPAIPELPILVETGRSWAPDVTWEVPPVIDHGDFRFALLICSEFTNIAYRAHLRGAVDALFIPEWNQDLHSFEALVEASALDLHAFIAQANTRGYGDTRLRAPGKDPWDRDVVRLQGGRHDYFVVGEIDHEKLRAFQLTPVVPPIPKPQKPGTYKPTPDGYAVDPERGG